MFAVLQIVQFFEIQMHVHEIKSFSQQTFVHYFLLILTICTNLSYKQCTNAQYGPKTKREQQKKRCSLMHFIWSWFTSLNTQIVVVLHCFISIIILIIYLSSVVPTSHGLQIYGFFRFENCLCWSEGSESHPPYGRTNCSEAAVWSRREEVRGVG